MDYAQDYLDDILVRMAYHSSGIEGNTISLPETVSIILEKSIIVMFNIVQYFPANKCQCLTLIFKIKIKK